MNLDDYSPKFHCAAVFTGTRGSSDDVGSQINIYSQWKCWRLLKATVSPLGELSVKNASAREQPGNALQVPNCSTSKQDVGDVGQGGILHMSDII